MIILPIEDDLRTAARFHVNDEFYDVKLSLAEFADLSIALSSHIITLISMRVIEDGYYDDIYRSYLKLYDKFIKVLEDEEFMKDRLRMLCPKLENIADDKSKD